MDLERRIELPRTILMPWLKFSEKFHHQFLLFLYLVTGFLRVTVSLLCRLQAVSKMHVPIYRYLISEGRQNCSTLRPAQQRNRDSQGTSYKIYKHPSAPWRMFTPYTNTHEIRWWRISFVTNTHQPQVPHHYFQRLWLFINTVMTSHAAAEIMTFLKNILW